MFVDLFLKDHLKELQSKQDLDKGFGRNKSPSNVSNDDHDTSSSYMNSNTRSWKYPDQASFTERVGKDKNGPCHDNPVPATFPLAINDPTQYAIDLTPPAPNRKDTCNNKEKSSQKRRRSSGPVCQKELYSSFSVEKRLDISKRMKVTSNFFTYGMLSSQEYYHLID